MRRMPKLNNQAFLQRLINRRDELERESQASGASLIEAKRIDDQAKADFEAFRVAVELQRKVLR